MQTDRPIQKAVEDRFDRAPFARRIAEVVSQRNDPATLVVGLFGPWGDGKSSTLSLIKEALGLVAPQVVIVDYNPWFFSSSQENLTRSFFLTLGEALERAGTFSKEKIGKLLRNYGGAVPKFGALLQAVGTSLSVADLKQTRAQVEEILFRHKTPIAVFVDDIDRLDRAEIQTLFKLIRLSADFPYVIYVLAFDDEIVAAALGEAYETGDKAAGRRFLEKIIQAPLHLPRAKIDSLRKLAFEAVDSVLRTSGVKLAEQETYYFANNFAMSIGPLLKTPRQVKLYENALTFAIPLLRDEVNVAELMLLEAIRTFLPRLYIAVRDNPDAFLKASGNVRSEEKTVDRLMSTALADMNLTPAEREGIQTWLIQKLFPRTSSMGYGNEWDAIWGKEKRISSPDYFHRYFSYGVPTGDIPDSLIVKVLSASQRGDQNSVQECFNTAINQSALPVLIRKLRTIEEDIPVDSVLSLIEAIANSSSALPRERGMGMDWNVVQAGILASHVAQRLPDATDRYGAVQRAFQKAGSFVFLFELLRFARETEEDGKKRGFLTENEVRSLTAIMVERLTELAKGEPLYRFLGDDARSVLLAWAWHGDGDSLRAVITDAVKQEGPDGAEQLLEVCAGKGWEMSTGIPHISDVRKDTYDLIKMISDPNVLIEVLKTRYGSKLDNPKYRSDDRELPVGERLATQFAFMHLKPENQKTSGDNDDNDDD